MKHIQLFLTGILFVAAITLASCHDDDTSDGGTESQPESREVTINLTLPESLPSASKQNEGTYAITATEENAIKSVDIFLFHPTTGVLVSAPVSCTKVEANGAVNKKKFTTKLLSGTYDIVLIANASDQVNAARTSMTVGTSTKINVLALFKKSTGVGVKWNAASSDNFEPIPMWGEMKNQPVDETTSLFNAKMVRMVAKVNVKSNTGTEAFRLRSVSVYGYNTEGFVAPVGDYTNNTVSNAKVSNPSLEGGGQTITDRPAVAEDNELVYTAMTTADVAIEEEIYLFEALKAQSRSEDDLKKATCLVIGGYFGSDTRESFYRIDFVKKTSLGEEDTYLDILRNHKYIVNIDRVDGRGYATADEAFLARPSNIDFGVVTIDEGEYNDTQFNGPYYFSVSKNNFGFTKEAYTPSANDNILKIKTDYPKGWKATLHGDANCTTTAPEWISLDKMSTTAASPATGDEVHIVLQQNNTGAARQAWIKLTCGSFEKEITVTQSADMLLSITPESWFEFPSGIGTAQSLVGRERTFDVVWSPKTNDIDIAVVKGATATDMFSFDDSDGRDNITDGLQISGATYAGRKTYKILPTAITEAEVTAAGGFPEKTSEIQYTLMDGSTKVTRTAYVKQVHYNVVAADMENLYMGRHTFTLHIRSNAKWRITAITENLEMGTNLLSKKAGDNLAVDLTGGPNIHDGDALIFTTTNVPAGNHSGQVAVKFESADTPKKFDDITIEIPINTRSWFNGHSGWASSNIYWDGRKLTFNDGVNGTYSNNQGVYFQWGSLYGISPGKTFDEKWTETTLIYNTPLGETQNGGAWDSWPRIGDKVNLSDESADPPAGMTDRNRAYLYDITDGNTGLGDICKYLTEKGWAPEGKWRMPTLQEFDPKKSYTEWFVDDNIDDNISTTKTDGRTRLSSGRYRTDYYPRVLFPASGYRYYFDGSMTEVKTNCFYWTSSPWGTASYSFFANKYNVMLNIGSARGLALPVRCVRE